MSSTRDRALEKRGMRFLLEEQEDLGQFEIRTRRDRPGHFVPAHAVVAATGGGTYSFFGPLARRRTGATKDDVAETGNVVWLDADAPTRLEELRVFEEAGIPPSLVLASGGGFWCYWKLAYLVSTNEIERLNERLIEFARPHLANVDRGAWNKNRCARLPGTLHEDTGVISHFVEEFCTWKWTDDWTLRHRLPEVVERRKATPPAPEVGPISDEAVRSVFNRFRWYIVEPPDEEDIHARGQSRHGIEFALVKALLQAGCREEEVIRLADAWALLKHMEYKRESPGKPYTYIEGTIEKAWAAIEEEPDREPPTEPPASLGRSSSSPKRTWNEVPRGEVLALIAQASDEGVVRNVKGWTSEIVDRYGCVVETAEHALKQLEQAGMIDKDRQPGVKGKAVLVTDAGLAFLKREGLKGRPIFLRSINSVEISEPKSSSRKRLLERPSRSRLSTEAEEQELESADTSEPEEGDDRGEEQEEQNPLHSLFLAYRGEHFGFALDHIFHGSLNASDREVELALKREWIDDTYRLSFLGRRSSWLLQFLSDEIVKQVLFYEQLFIGFAPYRLSEDETSMMPVYRSFISQNDDGVIDPADDLIQKRSWETNAGKRVKLTPKWYTFGVGAIVEAPGVPESYSIVTTEGVQEARPKVGLIVERDWTFWKALRLCQQREKVERLTDYVFQVTRSGPAKSHTFEFTVTADAEPIQVAPEHEVDLDLVLNTLVSDERLEALISGLSEDHIPWR